jgi:hypothetical protein
VDQVAAATPPADAELELEEDSEELEDEEAAAAAAAPTLLDWATGAEAETQWTETDSLERLERSTEGGVHVVVWWKSEAETGPEAPVQSGCGIEGSENETVGADQVDPELELELEDELELEELDVPRSRVTEGGFQWLDLERDLKVVWDSLACPLKLGTVMW